jgi:predicted O-methyltransferase YrrM
MSTVLAAPPWLGALAATPVVFFDMRRRRLEARHARVLEWLDLASPALVVAYAVECLWAANGRPAWDAVATTFIAAYLWRRGTRAVRQPLAQGVITGEMLMLGSVAALLLTATGQHPYSRASLLAALVVGTIGAALTVVVRRRFRKSDAVRRVLQHVVRYGSEVKPEYHRPTPECPAPERWRMLDTMTAELEVLDFLRCLVTTLKPQLILETGTFLGLSALAMAEGLRENGFGRIVTCDPDPEVFARAKERIEASGLGDWIDARCQPSLSLVVPATIDMLFCDSLPELREPEVRRFLPHMNPNGVILMHDASSHLKTVREAARRLEDEGLVSVVLLPTPRGLVLAQKRAGRA